MMLRTRRIDDDDGVSLRFRDEKGIRDWNKMRLAFPRPSTQSNLNSTEAIQARNSLKVMTSAPDLN